MMKQIAMVGAAALMTTGAAFAQDAKPEAAETKELMIGDKAPALKHVEWVKGDAINEYRSGDIYILDFWATWCGPCIAAIPHMNEIAKKHADDGVHVVGVAISDKLPLVQDFVKEKGDAMSYLIAYDDQTRKTAGVYMDGTMSRGIPTVMIINREGTLSWIGHPMNGMDDALEAIVDGTYDLAAAKKADEERREGAREAAKARAEQMAINKKITPIYQKVEEAMLAGDYADALALLDEVIAVAPDKLVSFHIQKYNIATTDMKDTAVARKIAGDIEGSSLMDDPSRLNMLAWGIVDPKGPMPEEMRDLDFALRTAQRADKLTDHANPSIIDTVARVWFEKGDVSKAITMQKKAIATQQKAIDEAADAQKQMMESMRASLEETLDEYMSAGADG